VKKIILISTFIVSLFIFNSNVFALEKNIDSTIVIGAAEVQDVFKICDASSKTLGAFKLGGIFITLAKIIAPIILIIMGMIDVSKAVTIGKDDAIKKSFSSFLKRVVAAVLLFFTPSIVLALFTFVDGFDGVNNAFKPCMDCLLKPSECQGDFSVSTSIDNSTSKSSTKK